MLNFKRLNEVIRDSGITKSFIATHFGKQRSMLNNWEKGKSTPSDEDIQELAALLGVSADYLEGKSDIKKGLPQKGRPCLLRSKNFLVQSMASLLKS